MMAAYRTLSGDMVEVLAEIRPINLRVWELVRIQMGTSKSIARQLLEQEMWDNSAKGAWTRRLTPRLAPWVRRKHGEITHHLTQFLSGHRVYRSYLFKFRQRRTPSCTNCGQVGTPEKASFSILNSHRSSIVQTSNHPF